MSGIDAPHLLRRARPAGAPPSSRSGPARRPGAWPVWERRADLLRRRHAHSGIPSPPASPAPVLGGVGIIPIPMDLPLETAQGKPFSRSSSGSTARSAATWRPSRSAGRRGPRRAAGHQARERIEDLKTAGPLWQLKVNCLRYCRFVTCTTTPRTRSSSRPCAPPTQALAPVVDEARSRPPLGLRSPRRGRSGGGGARRRGLRLARPPLRGPRCPRRRAPRPPRLRGAERRPDDPQVSPERTPSRG